MTAETKADMEAAIERHFTSESDGALLGGYILQAFGSNVGDIEEAGVRTLREVPDTQNIVTSIGLVHYAETTLSGQLTAEKRYPLQTKADWDLLERDIERARASSRADVTTVEAAADDLKHRLGE